MDPDAAFLRRTPTLTPSDTPSQGPKRTHDSLTLLGDAFGVPPRPPSEGENQGHHRRRTRRERLPSFLRPRRKLLQRGERDQEDDASVITAHYVHPGE